MIPMPGSATLIKSMTEALPLGCYSNKRNTKALAEQGLKLSDKTLLEVVNVHDMGEAGGVMCDIKYPKTGQVLIMSITGLNFVNNGPIDDEIAEYKRARIEWLKQEKRLDRENDIGGRVKVFYTPDEYLPAPKISRNALCPCGSGKKFKNCCLK